jgi:amino acid transporter
MSLSHSYAMSTDGLLPSKLSYVSEGRHVPVIATCLACFIIALLGTFFDIKVRKINME